MSRCLSRAGAEADGVAAVGEKIRSMPPIKRNTRARSGSTVTDGGTSAKDAKAAKEFEKKEAAKIRRKERDQARKREATELKEADQARKREAKEVKEAKEAAASSKAGRGRESRVRTLGSGSQEVLANDSLWAQTR